jgi:uncharacterized membrane protein
MNEREFTIIVGAMVAMFALSCGHPFIALFIFWAVL